ncbi:hypothetical protein SHL15_8437 [Streptomyces hygroscopicus subsp. limoneus]|nr:hypothetical protein SHL15_8437 [Streptomyces hygroscopicus subsp. limoneus]
MGRRGPLAGTVPARGPRRVGVREPSGRRRRARRSGRGSPSRRGTGASGRGTATRRGGSAGPGRRGPGRRGRRPAAARAPRRSTWRCGTPARRRIQAVGRRGVVGQGGQRACGRGGRAVLLAHWRDSGCSCAPGASACGAAPASRLDGDVAGPARPRPPPRRPVMCSWASRPRRTWRSRPRSATWRACACGSIGSGAVSGGAGSGGAATGAGPCADGTPALRRGLLPGAGSGPRAVRSVTASSLPVWPMRGGGGPVRSRDLQPAHPLPQEHEREADCRRQGPDESNPPSRPRP